MKWPWVVGLLALAHAVPAGAQPRCLGFGCACNTSGCSCPGSGCVFSCLDGDRCLFQAPGGSVNCLDMARCDLVLNGSTLLNCTTTDRCEGELGAGSEVFQSGAGELRVGLGAASTVECQPDTILGRCEVNCRGSCLLRCTPTAGGDCRLFCSDGGAPAPCGAGGYVGCDRGCGFLDAGTSDAGPVDAGSADAGIGDAGVDAGSIDAGAFDAGSDAGTDDAGPDDAGTEDAGGPDAGSPDAGPPNDGGVDGGQMMTEADAGPREAPYMHMVGCACDGAGGGALSWLLLALLSGGRASRRRRSGTGARSRPPSRSAPGSP